MEQHLGSKLVGKRNASVICPSTVEVALPTLTPEYATGVYCWLNRVNGKRYVGSAAKSILRRMRKHQQDLSKNRHPNRHLQSAWNKYGSRKFAFVILERCAPKDCLVREQYWMDKYRSANPKFGYNIAPKAGSTLGVKLGKPTKEHSRNRALALAGKRGGWKHTEATKAKMRERRHTEEAKAKMSATRKGNTFISAEQRAKTSATLMGHPVSKEQIAKTKATWARKKLLKKAGAQ